MLTEKDLNNLGEWDPQHCKFDHLKIGKHKLYRFIDFHFSIYDDNNIKIIPNFKAETKEELSKMCYPFLGKDLDFSPKKDYSWIRVFSSFGVEQYNMCVEFFNSLLDLNLLTEKEKESIKAGFKLRLIIKQINVDFPSVDELNYSPYATSRKEIHCHTTLNKPNNLECHSQEGFDKLIDTNTPLLKQYFGIE